MKIEKSEMHATVREGYQILLRAEAKLLMPVEYADICAFYEQTANACMRWVTEVYGERVRRAFSALESVRERSGFYTRTYRFQMRVPWESDTLAAILCETELRGNGYEGERSYRRLCHVWSLDEQTVLPQSQILEVFRFPLKSRSLPFRADGVYPEGRFMVFFRNASENRLFLEKKLPYGEAKPKKRKKCKKER